MTVIDSAYLIRFFRRAAERLEEARQHLCQLDGEIGDGDHGTSMANGFSAVIKKQREIGVLPPDKLLREAAGVFLGEVGATVGPLYASGMLKAAQRFGAGPMSDRDLPLFLSDMAIGIAERGKAGIGDKTMLDVWLPAARAATEIAQQGGSGAEIARSATMAAQKAAKATTAMIASRGRAAHLKERSLGHIDPGAASAAIIIDIFRELASGGAD